MSHCVHHFLSLIAKRLHFKRKWFVSSVVPQVHNGLSKIFLEYKYLWFILRGDLFYVVPCVILFLCFSVLLALQLSRLGKRELLLVLSVRLFDLRLFGFFCFLFLLVSCLGLWLWHSLDFSLTILFLFTRCSTIFTYKIHITLLQSRNDIRTIQSQKRITVQA